MNAKRNTIHGSKIENVLSIVRCPNRITLEVDV